MICSNSSVVSSESVSSESEESEGEDWERSIVLVGGSSSDSRLLLGVAGNLSLSVSLAAVDDVVAVDAVVFALFLKFDLSARSGFLFDGGDSAAAAAASASVTADAKLGVFFGLKSNVLFAFVSASATAAAPVCGVVDVANGEVSSCFLLLISVRPSFLRISLVSA